MAEIPLSYIIEGQMRSESNPGLISYVRKINIPLSPPIKKTTVRKIHPSMKGFISPLTKT